MKNSKKFKLIGYRFSNDVANISEEEIQRRADKLAEYLSDQVNLGSFGNYYTFYNDGFIRSLGFQYIPEDPIRILVNVNRENIWTVRYVTTRDPKIISKCVRAYEDFISGNLHWMYYPTDVYEL